MRYSTGTVLPNNQALMSGFKNVIVLNLLPIFDIRDGTPDYICLIIIYKEQECSKKRSPEFIFSSLELAPNPLPPDSLHKQALPARE
jgi:hypothetical protein